MSALTLEELQNEQAGLGFRILQFWHNVIEEKGYFQPIELLKERVKLLDQYWNTFFQNHRKLMRCDGATKSTYIQDNMFGNIEGMYTSVKTLVDLYLGLYEARSKLSEFLGDTEPLFDVAPELPKLDLPVFTGMKDNATFRGCYTNLVNKATHLTKEQRKQYLNSVLPYGWTDSDTDVDIELLKKECNEMFRRDQYKFSKILVFCPRVQSHSSRELRRVLDIFQKTIGWRQPEDTFNEIEDCYSLILTEKLDETTRKAWETSHYGSQPLPDYYRLSEFLQNYITVLEAAELRDKEQSTSQHAANKNSKANGTGKRT